MFYGVRDSYDYEQRKNDRYDENVGVREPPRVVFH
jgi:hypothetical protein